jgi:hypothetical protein
MRFLAFALPDFGEARAGPFQRLYSETRSRIQPTFSFVSAYRQVATRFRFPNAAKSSVETFSNLFHALRRFKTRESAAV